MISPILLKRPRYPAGNFLCEKGGNILLISQMLILMKATPEDIIGMGKVLGGLKDRPIENHYIP